jgi:hypothetical protein
LHDGFAQSAGTFATKLGREGFTKTEAYQKVNLEFEEDEKRERAASRMGCEDLCLAMCIEKCPMTVAFWLRDGQKTTTDVQTSGDA